MPRIGPPGLGRKIDHEGHILLQRIALDHFHPYRRVQQWSHEHLPEDRTLAGAGRAPDPGLVHTLCAARAILEGSYSLPMSIGGRDLPLLPPKSSSCARRPLNPDGLNCKRIPSGGNPPLCNLHGLLLAGTVRNGECVKQQDSAGCFHKGQRMTVHWNVVSPGLLFSDTSISAEHRYYEKRLIPLTKACPHFVSDGG